MTSRGEALVHIGTIAGPIGLRGGAKVRAGDPDDFTVGLRVIARTETAERALRIDGIRDTPASFTVRFAGIETRTAIEPLRGADLFAASADLPSLAKNVFRAADLVGMRVCDERLGELGTVREVRSYPQCAMLVVGERDLLVPMLAAYGIRVDAGRHIIEARLPEGFEDL